MERKYRANVLSVADLLHHVGALELTRYWNKLVGGKRFKLRIMIRSLKVLPPPNARMDCTPRGSGTSTLAPHLLLDDGPHVHPSQSSQGPLFIVAGPGALFGSPATNRIGRITSMWARSPHGQLPSRAGWAFLLVTKDALEVEHDEHEHGLGFPTGTGDRLTAQFRVQTTSAHTAGDVLAFTVSP